MERPSKGASFLLLLGWLGVSWGARLPRPPISSNATIFSHVYTIKVAGENTPGEGASPPPQEALGPPGSSRGGGQYEHTLEGSDQEHVVFTHRINLPPQSCGCPPGTEDTRELWRRLQALESEVRALQETCQAGGGCCPAAASSSSQASEGQTDIRTLCSHHGSFDLSRCLCECESGWGGPTCAEPICSGGCGGAERGSCVNGHCQCQPGYSGVSCEEPPSCPEDCNDQGRCVDGRCTCFPGYVGPSCSDPVCPQNCHGHGQCTSGGCVCNPGYTGTDCATRACPSNCNRRGECRNGRCVCEPGFTGPACGTKTCPNDCNQRGHCLQGGVCSCHPDYTGPDCGQLACLGHCSGHGECQNGTCVCNSGYSGEDCSVEIPSIGVRVSNRDETSFRLEWNYPDISVDGYEIHVAPTKNPRAGESAHLSGTERIFEYKGLKPGEEYTVTVRVEKGQHYGPPVTQTVRTRVAPPSGLHSSQVSENSLTLQWEPPASRPDGYFLSYVPLVPTRPVQAMKRVELPAVPERVTLEDLESRTRYRLTLVARQSGENSRATSIVVSTTAPAPIQPSRHHLTPTPSFHKKPDTSSSEPEEKKPGIKPHPGRRPTNTTLLTKEHFLKRMTQNISSKLSPYNGTLLERLESYLRATKFPLRGNQTIQSVARDIYLYLKRAKPIEFQERVEERLVQETSNLTVKREFPITEAESVYSDGYLRPDHAKPTVVTSSPNWIEVSLDSVRGISDHVVIRYRNMVTGETKELVVPGDASRAIITGLSPGTSYLMEIHGVMRGHSSKSYSFITATASVPTMLAFGVKPAYAIALLLLLLLLLLPPPSHIQTTSSKSPSSPTNDKIQTITPPILTPLKNLQVTEVSPNQLRVTWSAPPNFFHNFSLYYRDPKSGAPPEKISIPGTERSVDLMDLHPGTEYEIQLHGERAGGSYSAPFSTKIITAVEPEEPRLGDFSLLSVTDTSVHLSWDAPTGPFDSFVIQYKDAEGKPKVLRMDKNTREATISNLVPSRKYRFNFYVLLGRKPFGPVSLEVVPGSSSTGKAPATFKDVSATVTSNSAHLSWTVSSGTFDSFLIQYKDAEGRLRELLTEGDSREITIPDLAPSHRYTIDLYGISSQRHLGPASITFITGSQEDVSVHKTILSDLAVSEVTSNSVHLTWRVPTGRFDSFLLQYQDSEGGDQALPMDQDSREAIIPNLVPSQRYRFNLYGILGTQRFGPIFADAVTAAVQEPKKEKPDETIAIKPSLGEFSILDVKSNSVRLYWTVPTGSFDSFLVQYKDADGQSQMLPVEGSFNEVTVPNLAPSHRYKFNLYGISGRKRSGPLSTDATTAHISGSGEPIPVQPSLGDFSILDVTSDSVRLHWTVPTGSFDSFLIQYKDADGQPQMLPVEGSFNEVTVTNLVPSRRYKFNLYGVSGRKRSTPLSTDATTAHISGSGEPIPVQPSLGDFSILDVTSDSVRLHWTVPTGSFDSFLIQYKDADGQPQVLPVEGDSHEVTVTNLIPSRRYKFNLYGVSGRKRSTPLSTDATTAPIPSIENAVPIQSSLWDFSVLDGTSDLVHLYCTIPTGSSDIFVVQYKDADGQPQGLPVEGGSNEVIWTVPTGSFDSFLIQYKDASGQPQALPVEGDSSEITVTNLVPSRRYKFNLYGVSGRKRSNPISTFAMTARLTDSEEQIPTQPSLGEFSVLDVTSDSVRLHWTVPTGSFDSFLIQYKDADGQPQALPVEGGSTEVTVTNLAPSRRYKFNLYGVSGKKRSRPLTTEATTVHLADSEEPVPLPLSLGKFSVVDVTSNSVQLHWTVPSGTFDSFLIRYMNADGQPQELPLEGDSNQVTVTSLAPSHIYKFNLYGISGNQRSSPLSTDATTARLTDTEEPIPVPPSLGDFSVLDVTSDSVRLHWTVPTGTFDSFLVQYKDADGQPQALPVEGDSREVTVTKLVPSRRYKFNLYGVSGRKRSRPLSTDATTAHLTDSVETSLVQPSLGEFSVLDVTSDSVHLYWTIVTGSFDSFLIQYKDADGQPQALPVEGNTHEVTVTNLVPSRRYKFNLYGISGRKRSSPLSTDATTGDFTVIEATSDSVHLHWTIPTGTFDSFLIQYKDADGQPQALTVEGNSHEVTVTNLVPSRRYKFNLYGVSRDKHSGPLSTDATTAHLTDSDEPIPAQPSLGEFSVLDVTSDSVRLHWTVSTGTFDSFLIQYKDADGQPQALPVEGDSREVTMTELVPSHRYKFNLYGISGRKRSGPLSTDATTVSKEATAVQPSLGEFSVLDVTSNSVRLHWTVPTGNFDSFLVQYKDADGQPQALPVEGGFNEVTVTDLVPSHRYKFNLYGVSGRKRSKPLSTDATTAHLTHSEKEMPIQPSLGEFSVLDITSDSVHLHWTVPTGNFDSFLVQYKDADGQPQALPVEGSSREVTVTNLVPSHRYKFNLYGVSGRKRFTPLSTDATTAHIRDSEKPIPVQPSLGDFSVLDVTSNSLRLYWTVPIGSFDSFLIQYKDADGQPQMLPVEGSLSEVTVTNLAPSHQYKFNLYGVSGGKRSGPLSTDATTAHLPDSEQPIPVQPSLGQFSVLDVTSNSVRLHWTVPTGSFDSFLVQYKDADGQPQILPVEGGTNEVTVTKLAPSHRYKFNLYGVSGRKRSSPLSTDATTAHPTDTEEPIPVQPSLGEFSVLDVMSNSVRLHWTVPTGTFDSFLVQYKDANGQPQALPVEGDSREVTVTELVPSRRYKFNLYGISGRKRSGPLSTDATTAPIPDGEKAIPVQPSLGEFSVLDVTSDSVRLYWTVSIGRFDSFLVQYKDADGQPQYKDADGQPQALPVEGGSREVTVANLAPSHRYKFLLYGVSGRKKTSVLSADAFTDPSSEAGDAIPVQPSLGELSVLDVTSDSVRLHWTVPTGNFDSFLIQYKDADGQPQALPVEGESREVTVTNLVPSRRYKFNLYGVSGRKRSGSLSIDATTARLADSEEPIPVQPSLGDFTVLDVTSDFVRLHWTVPTGTFDSFLIQYKDADGQPQALPVEGGFNEVTVTDLVPSRRYKFNLYGVSGHKRSGPLSTDATTASLSDSEEPIPAQPSLGEFSVLDVTSDSVRLHWTVSTGTFDSFLIQYKDADGQPQALPVEGDSREVTMTELVPSRRYKFNLYGISGRKRSGPLSTDATTAQLTHSEEEISIQPSLGDFSVLDVTSDSVRLHWTIATGRFDSFLVQYKDADGQPQALPVEGDSREVTVANLAPSRRYKFNLYGVSGRKRSRPLSTNATTAHLTDSVETNPVQPSLGEFSVLDVTSDSVHLYWSIVSGSFDSFLIQYKDADGQPQALPVEENSREVTVTNLAPSRRYKFNLYGISGHKRTSPLSTDATTDSKEAVPVQTSLRNFSVLQVTSDSLQLPWTVPTGTFDSFLIQYKDADGQPQALPVEGNSHEVTVTKLAPSCRYKFNLYGVSGHKRSGPLSTAPLATTPPVQPSLGELSVSSLTHNSALLSWTVHAGDFDSFMIQYKDVDGKPQAIPVEGNSYQVILSDLVPGRRYKFNLYGVSGRRRFGPVSVDAMTAPDRQDPVIPPTLGEVSASEITSNSVHLSWTVLEGRFDSFAIQYKDAEGQPQAVPVEGDLREMTIPNLVPSRKYKFNLYGLSGRKRMGPVSVDAITASTTKKEATPKPSLGELSISEVTHNSVLLSWTISVGRFDSFLLHYKDEEGRTQTLPVGGDSHQVAVLNLAPSYKYKFNLYGISGQKRIGPISSEATTAEPEEEKEGEEEEEEDEDGKNQPSLGKLSISEITSNSLHLSWSVPTGSFDSFLIQYEDGALKSLPVDGASRETVVSNLTPSHNYQFDLFGISSGKRLGPISAEALTAPLSPSQDRRESGSPGPSPNPSFGELSVSDVTSNSVRLSWNVPAETFDSFQIQYKDAENKPQMTPVDKETNTIVIYYLVPSHRYKFNLYGISGHRRFGPITASAITAPGDNGDGGQEVSGGISPRLGALSVSEVTSHSARLSWTVPEGSFDAFSVQYKDAEGRPQALPLRGDSREVIVSNLSPSHKYKFNLYGIFGKQRLGPISAQAVTTAAETSGQVEEKKQPEETTIKSIQPNLGNVTVSEVTPDSLLLSWNVQEGNFDSFIIQYKDAAGKPQRVPVDGSMRSLHLYNLTPSHTYEFDVFGVSGYKHLGPLSIHTMTEISEGERSVQPQLGNLSVSRVTNDSVALFWTVAAGKFDSFLLQYKDSQGKPQVLPLNSTSRDLSITSLTPSHRYKFNLYGLNGRKRLGPVSTNAVTGQGTQPLKLGTLSAHNITSESLLLSWTVESGNFDSFVIEYRDAKGKFHELPVDGGLRLLRFHDLVPSHRYKFNLYGVSRHKRLGPISVEAVTVSKPSGLQVAPQPKLGILSASNISDTSLRLTWRVLTGKFESFSIEYRDAEGRIQVLPVDTNARDVVISNLVPSYRYIFNLYGISQQKQFGPVSTAAVTAQVKDSEAKPKLGDLSISGVTNDSVRLSWTVSSGRFDSFLIRYKDAQGNPQTVPVGVDSWTVFISNLIPSHKYKFSLYGISGKKQFGPVSIDAVTAAFSESASSPAPLLSHLTVFELTSTMLQLSWDVPEGEFDSFVVRWKGNLSSGQTPVPAKEVKVPGDERSVTLQGLAPSTEYSFTVYGIKDESEVANITTGAKTRGLELDGPRDLRFSDIYENSVLINWSPPSSRIDGYKISFQPSDGGEPKSISVDGSQFRSRIEGLTPGTSYEVAVMSIRGFEESEPLMGYVTTVPNGPSDLWVVNVTDTSALLTWRPVAEMNNYIVTYGPITGTGSQVSESVPGNRVQLQLSELQKDMEYWANVYGEKKGKRSSSISATFTTGADGPRNLHATEISPRSAHLIWSPPSAPSEGYLLSYETPDGQSKEIPLDASFTSYELQDLIPSSRYRVQVQAMRRGTPTAPISTSFTTKLLTYPFPRDCSEEIQNGPGPSRVTTIYPGNNEFNPLRVFCDMETDGGGWIVFQRRMNGETDFWRDWKSYALGFGNLTREFWLGNEFLHQLTSSGDYELRVDLRTKDESVYATYQNFRVDSYADYYRLHLGSYRGTAGDSLSYHSGSVFSTRDRDPNRVIIPCAISYRGAWWYRNCHYTNLNGLYANNRDHQGVNWFTWKGFEFSIPFTEMKLRPSSFRPRQRS
ncbi:LOW QUALITY PROTEIN: tenascin-X-like [Vipera latastei]